MIKYLKKIYYVFIYNKILIFFYKEKLKYVEFHFQNILFSDHDLLKKIFLSKIYLKNKFYDKKNYAYHTFEWLNIAKKYGGADNIKKAKENIFNWKNKKFRYNSPIWKNNLIAQRFINLLYSYDFFIILSNKKEIIEINKILYKHFLLLNFNIKNENIYNLTIEDLKAFFLGSLLFKNNTDFAISIMNQLINTQIDQNGFHKSYNSLTHAKFINHLYELKNIFLFFKIKLPPLIDFQISNMSSLLLNLFHKDGTVCLFNGSNNFHLDKIYNILKIAEDIVPKNINKSQLGILIFNDKNKKIFMDITKPINKKINSNLHAGTLSFEFSINNEKIITNCGAIDKKIGKNQDYLRYSAAHSTIIVNNTNISELTNKNSYLRIPKNIIFNNIESENKSIWETSHDGYLKNYKKIIKRKLIIYKKNNNIDGEDSIISTKFTLKKIVFHIRFHLMPSCNCILTNNKKNILIKTKNKQSLIFKSDSNLTIEDSIIINKENKIQYSKQIVISGYTDNIKKTIKWSIINS